jgi:hypothetical protein
MHAFKRGEYQLLQQLSGAKLVDRIAPIAKKPITKSKSRRGASVEQAGVRVRPQ